MKVDVARVVAKLLATTGTVGVLVACKCPPAIPAGADEVVPPSTELADLLRGVLATQRIEDCNTVCDTYAGPYDWTCTWAPADALVPEEVRCSWEGPEPFTEVVDLRPGDTAAGDTGPAAPVVPQPPPGSLVQLDGYTCDSICRDTAGYQLVVDEGYDRGSVPVSCTVLGETVEAAAVHCTYLTPECIGGRRPLAGEGDGPDGPGVGAWWAGMARVEAASVPAFEELLRDLIRHGAPDDLVQRARVAIEDERVHTRLCLARAAAHGVAHVVLPRIDPAPPVDLHTLAVHNAREGCVLEAFAALEAGVQAQQATDPEDRAVLARIHADEVRHAQLSWDLHAWATERLGPALEQEVAAAFEGLAARAADPVEEGLRVALGLPVPAARRALVEGLAAGLAA